MSKTKTPVGLTYVKEFEFPSAQGFTGSAGKQPVKGYMRGGKVKACPKSKAHQKMPPNVKMKGGKVNAQMGGYMGPEREISVDDVDISVPRARGGKTSMHNKLKAAGAKMGYAYGGMVKGRKNSIGATPDDVGLKNWDKHKKKNTSKRFKMKKGKQDSMDDGVQPARRGRNSQEIEAGGTPRLKPGYKKGGKAKKGMRTVDMSPSAERKQEVRKVRGALSDKDRSKGKGMPKGALSDKDRSKGKGMSKKGFPATVKARGGLASAADRTKGKGMGRRGFPATVRAKGGRSC